MAKRDNDGSDGITGITGGSGGSGGGGAQGSRGGDGGDGGGEEDDEISLLIRQLPEMLQPLARRGVVRLYPKGMSIVEEGTFGDMLYIVLKGSVKAYSEDFNEHDITFATHRAGSYFGEMALDKGVRSASVVALEKTFCSVVTVHSTWEFVEHSPAFVRDLILQLISRSRRATEQARALVQLDAASRLSGLLNKLAGPPDEHGVRVIDEPLTPNKLKGLIGCCRVRASRLVNGLERDGYIATRDGKWRVLRKLPGLR